MSYENELYHYGTPRHSGRYPWGSGKDPYQRNTNFRKTVSDLRNQGLSDTEIAAAMKIKGHNGKPSVAMLRALESRAVVDIRKENMNRVTTLRDKGYSWQAIADEVGLENESTARTLYNRAKSGKKELLDVASDALKEELEKKQFLDVGPGSEVNLGVTNQKLKTAVLDLEAQGYQVFTPRVGQAGMNGKTTTLTVLAPPDATFKECLEAMKSNKIGLIGTHIEEDENGGYTKYGMEKPKSVDSSKVAVLYNEEGGVDRDGLILLRRGVEDLDLGSSHYAQVRIAVDDGYYLKGMAMYADEGEIPKGYDILVNSNKHVGTPLINGEHGVAKQMKVDKKTGEIDEENPFGSSVVQHHYVDKNGETQLSALNIVGSTEADEHKEGAWNTWSKQISAQFLSKQDPKVAKRQLDKTLKEKQEEYEEIQSLTNPIVKKKLLEEFADSCDSDAVSLKASGFSRQRTQVILPFTDIKENEVYAPNFKNGEQVALVRFPHAGTFEIPQLTVNNTKSIGSAYKKLDGAQDAVGINAKTASILSGADFDGDTVVVIPLTDNHLKTRKTTKLTKELAEIQNFEPKELYKLPDSVPKMSDKTKQKQMGEVSNLITDMTIKGASAEQLARAVKHSMVVIDAQKHHLDYKQSAKDFNIKELKEEFQNNGNGKHGASTLISRAKSETMVDERKAYYLSGDHIDSEGNKVYEKTNRSYMKVKDAVTGKWRLKKYNDTADDYTESKVIKNQTKSTKMAETKDAMTLLSGPNHEGSDIERVYGNYANALKSLANSARKEYVSTPSTAYNKDAAKAYKAEVESLNTKLLKYNSQKPLERKAQIIANKVVSEEKANSVEPMSSKEVAKVKSRALRAARETVYGSKNRYRPDITEKEWEAIQNGAVSTNKAKQILEAADSSLVKSYATPRNKQTISTTKQARIKSLKSKGLTAAEIAEATGVSVSSVYRIAGGEE